MNELTIVTVNKQSGILLEKTAESIFPALQSGIVKWHIQDCFSTDLPEHIISNSNVKFVQLKDHGIYNAMNIALSYLDTEFVLFLNSGDYITNVENLINALKWIKKNSLDCGYSDVLLGNSIKEYPCGNIYSYLFFKSVCHQSTIVRSESFRLVGDYDESFQVRADHDWLLRCLNSDCVVGKVPFVYSSYGLGGYSSWESVRNQNKNEIWKIRKKHYKGATYIILLAKLLSKRLSGNRNFSNYV